MADGHSCPQTRLTRPTDIRRAMSFQRVSIFLFAAILSVTASMAQVAGRLSGVVVDPSGAAIPGASVDVLASGGKEALLKGRTDEAGVFTFVTVRPGSYDVAVEAGGFARTVVRDVR